MLELVLHFSVFIGSNSKSTSSCFAQSCTRVK
jgi:hypothetical protein